MRKLLALVLLCSCSIPLLAADDEDATKPVKRVEAAATVLNEIQSAPDQGIPENVLGSAECVAVVPTLLKGGFIFGGRYGKGVASCRTEKGWSAPAFFMIGGGSFGLQIGGEAVDLVMLIMNKDGMKNLLSSKFKLGADASVAAGPVGRHAAADTDWKLRAQVLTRKVDVLVQRHKKPFPVQFPVLDLGAKPLEPFGERLECSEGGSTGRQTNSPTGFKRSRPSVQLPTRIDGAGGL